MQRDRGFDRVALAPGQTPQRPLLNNAAVALSNTPKGTSPNELLTSPVPSSGKTTDTISPDISKNISKRNSTTSRLLRSVSKFITHRNNDVRPSANEMWNTAESCLRNNDFESAKKYLDQIRRLHTKKEKHIQLGYIKAVSILAILAVIDEWDSSEILTHSTSKRVLDALAVGSTDVIAFAVHFYFQNRWTCPSDVSIDDICNLLEKAASQGHPASQAVLGELLCRSSCLRDQVVDTENVTNTNNHGEQYQINVDSKSMDLQEEKNETVKQKVNKKKARIIPRIGDRTPGTIWLKRSAVQGYFLALDYIEECILGPTKNIKSISKSDRQCDTTNTKDEEVDILTDCITREEYYSLVRSGADAQIAHCSLRMCRLVGKGIGCVKDKAIALEWIEKAAELNLPSAISALHAEMTRKNMKLAEILAGSGELCEVSDQASRSNMIARLRKNREVIQKCEEQMIPWRKNDPHLRKIVVIHRICNLQTRITLSLCESLLRFIFERDRDGWCITLPKL